MYAWTEASPYASWNMRPPVADTDPKALACYGLLLPQTDTMLWRFVTGRPVSQSPVTISAWVADRLAQTARRPCC